MIIELRNDSYDEKPPAVVWALQTDDVGKDDAVLMAQKLLSKDVVANSAHIFVDGHEIVVSKVSSWMSNNG